MTKPLAILFAGTAMAFIAGCSKSTIPDKKEISYAPVTPIALAAPVNQSMSSFAFTFFKNLQNTQPADQNIFVSPLSLHIAMGMVANGAASDTRTEILKALHAENLPADLLNQSYLTLLEQLPKADPGVTLSIANSLWYKNNFTVDGNFIKAMQDYFKAKVTGLGFLPSDIATVNKWASDNTNGKIPKVIDKFDEDLVLLLMNALYFKGDWRVKFDKAQTRAREFTKTDGSKLQVTMMHRVDTVGYAAGSAFDAVRKPYGNGQFTITIILPKQGTSITSCFNEMTAGAWTALQNAFTTAELEVGLPKFKLEQHFDLNSSLQAMGIQKAFTDFADFGNLSKTPTRISYVKQQTFAAVDEEGTEAAAVTTVGMVPTAAPMITQFICDHPFGIIISENTSGTILFMGRITEPVSQ